MTIFNLPDLGEGLPDAEIHEWHVKVGDKVTTDQLLVSMETAKAVVDVPSPQDGIITKLYGNPGDIIETGSPLIAFEAVAVASEKPAPAKAQGGATVAGSIEVGDKVIKENATGVTPTNTEKSLQILPAHRAMAKQLKVDLSRVTPTGKKGEITLEDIMAAAKIEGNTAPAVEGDAVPLRGVRRSMAQAMAMAHKNVVPVTLSDEADIHQWPEGTDITARVIRAITKACEAEPSLNAHFDGEALARVLKKEVNLGLAMDSPDGLFVPVIKNAQALSLKDIRKQIDDFKPKVKDRTIPASDLQGATISLSNFGNFAGRYANPIVVPPMVAIVGTGKLRDQVVAYEGKMAIHRCIPLSVTIDHRAVTGGEVARFLKALIDDLEKP